MSDGWTSEIDLIEVTVDAKGAPCLIYSMTLMTNQGNNKVQVTVSLAGIDFSKPHLWQTKWTLQGTTLTCDGKVVATSNFVNNAPQFIALQVQTGDPIQAPASDAGQYTMYFDWVAIDVPS
jgi:hypothetical protein